MISEATWVGVFVVANVLVFVFGVVITGLSYRAYLASGRTATFRNSTLGFLLITVGGVLAPVYQLWIKSDYVVSTEELLELQILEGTLIAFGLALLLVSIYGYGRSPTHVSLDFETDGTGSETDRTGSETGRTGFETETREFGDRDDC